MAGITLPSGLMINIEKNILGLHHEDDGVLGYYDRLEIKPVYHWFDYLPHKVLSGKGQARKQTISFYPIKLLFPDQDVMKSLKDKGLDYKSWQEIYSTSRKQKSRANSFFSQFPCVTVALINLTDKFKGPAPRKTCSTQLIRLAKTIEGFEQTLQGTNNEDFSEAHCCVLPTLGYSDYCILLAERHWNIAPRLMEYLHAASCANETPLLSTDYMLPVYHLAGGSGFSAPQSNDPTVQLSVRVNLHPGVSMKSLAYTVQEYADVYQISGTADCMLVSRSNETVGDLLRMLAPKRDGGDDRLVPLALNTAAFLQRPIQGNNEDSDHPLARSTTVEEQIETLREVLDCYRHLLDKHHRHTRQLYALYDQISVIENICGNLHNQSLQQIMTQWLQAFEDCLKRCINQIVESEFESWVKDEWEMVEEALSIFIDEAGSFLADLSRSDCFFVETEQYNHPSVGSATALLIGYNRWQNSFAKAVMGKNNSTYSFLIRSGGCDSTHTKGLFWFLRPTILPNGKIQEHLPFIIQMSEAGLFDCCGTIFRMTHECMHFCGDRKRKERASYLIKFVSAFYGRVIASALLNQHSTVGLLIRNLHTVFQVQDTKVDGGLLEIWKDEFAWFQGQITYELQKELTDYLCQDSEAEGWKEVDFMSTTFGEWIERQLDSLFTGFTLDEKKPNVFIRFVNILYAHQHVVVARFYERCDELIKRDRELRFCALEARRKEDVNIEDETLTKWIPLMLNQLVMSTQDDSLDLTYGDEAPISRLRGQNIHSIMREIVLDCFSETFADMEACIRLDATFVDYILAFVFESWDLKEIGLPASYRIPVVLKICFPDVLAADGGALTDDAQKKLQDAIEALKSHGMPENRILPQMLVNDLNELLKTYKEDELYVEGKALEEYLQLCKDSYAEEEKKRMEPYRKAFHRIHDLQMVKCKSAQMEKLVGLRLFNALTSIK